MYPGFALNVLFKVYDALLRSSTHEAAQLLFNDGAWDEKQKRKYQGVRLNQLLTHAKNNVPYYRPYLKHYDENNKSYKYNSDYLQELPILTKAIIQEFHSDLKSADFIKFKPRLQRTGGTTGEPTIFYHDHKKLDFTRMALLRSFYWANYTVGKKCLKTGAGQHEVTINKGLKGKVKGWLYNRTFVDGSNLHDEAVDKILKKLTSGKYKVLWGYASLINELASIPYVKQLNIKLDTVITSSEMLFPYQRNRIVEAFNAPVFDNYSSREFAIAAECASHAGLHVNEELLFVELLDETNHRINDDDKSGKIIITDLLNYSFQFIRYEIGDLASWQEGKCPCGLNHRRFARIIGRESDIIRLNHGIRIPPTFFPDYFKIYDHIVDYMIEIIDNDSILIKVLSNRNDSEVFNNKIESDLSSHFPGISMHVENASIIERTIGGKRKFITDTREK